MFSNFLELSVWINGANKGILIENFDRSSFLKSHGISGNAKVLLTLSRLEVWKRIDRAIWLISQIKDRVPEAILIVAGEGDMKNQLEVMADRLGVREKVIFAGGIPHSEVKQYINACDIFLSLYDHSNLCNPVLEALECGKCIVSIDDGSTREVLKHYYNAILIPKNELKKKLPATVINLLRNSKAREALGENALDYAQTNLLSWQDRMNMEIDEVNKLLR